jgi:HlyD family secretion protein
MKKKVILSSLLLIVLVLAGYYIFLGNKAKKYEFRFDKASTGDLTVYVTATGTINPVTSVDVGTQVSGIVSKLYADFNSVVKKGQVIAQIDSTFLVQAVKDAEANLDKTKAQFEESKRNLAREKAMLDRGLESQVNYDAALTTYEANAASMKSAQASIDRAKINLAYSTIYAPISGVVVNRAVNIGQTVAASFSSPTLYTIANDLSRMQVLTTVDESDIGRISIGQEATFSVDSYPDETFKGTVSQIRLAPVTVQNVVNYTVVIEVNNDQLKLMPGMTANVKILVAKAQNVLKIPNMALRFQPPAEVIDTAKVSSMREGMGRFPRDGGGAPPESMIASRGPDGAPGPDGPGGGGPGMEGRRERFRALRDSITAAHGGTISEEDLRAEMRKVLGDVFRGGPQRQAAPAAVTVKPPARTQFGIDLRFPEFQKSAYVPSQQTGRGRVWMLNASGKLEPVMVRTGITDGRSTEVRSQFLKEGDQVVLGIIYDADSQKEQARSPLTPQGGGPRPGGGFR